MDAHQQREKHARKHRRESEEKILEADHLVVEAEDPLADEALRGRVGVRFQGSRTVSCHIIACPPPVPPTIYQILPGSRLLRCRASCSAPARTIRRTRSQNPPSVSA